MAHDGGMLDGALAAAKFGAVLPLNADRRPLVTFDQASQEPEAIRSLWARFPEAGVGLGAWSSELLVIDVESPAKKEGGADGFATMRGLVKQLGPLRRTRTHTTKSGGKHYVFRLPTGLQLRSSQGFIRGAELSAPGVDIVTGRAVLRWPPTPGYGLEGEKQDCVELSGSWVKALTDPPRAPEEPKYFDDSTHIARYVSRALERESADLAGVQAVRNCACFASAFKMGTLAEHLSFERVVTALMQACEANGSAREHGHRACISTITRGFRSGTKEPRRLEF